MVEIRRATVADADALARVHTTTWQVAYRGIVPDHILEALSEDERADRWRHDLAQGSETDVTTLIAVDEREVLGFASVGPCRDEDIPSGEFAELYAIYVVPEAWGRGIGADLLDAAVRPPLDAGLSLMLWVLSGNQRARAFYERAGWTPDGATGHHEVGGAQLPVVRYRTTRV